MSKNEFTTSVSAGICLETSEGDLILVRQRSSQMWGIPAGHMRSLESPVATMYRELEEETGIRRIQIADIGLQGMYPIPRDETHTSLGIVLRGKFFGELDPTFHCDEIDKVGVFGKILLGNLIARPTLLYKPEFNQRVLMDWINGRTNLIF